MMLKKTMTFSAVVALLAGCECGLDGKSCAVKTGDDRFSAAAVVNTEGDASGDMMTSGTMIDVDAVATGFPEENSVYFATNEYKVTAQFQKVLENQADWLKQNPGVSVLVEGHCDERGTREYNLALGERRANAAKDYLVSLGVDAGRISTISYGKDKPLVLGSTPEDWALNRVTVTAVQ